MTKLLPIPAPPHPAVVRVQSNARLTSALGLADPGFVGAVAREQRRLDVPGATLDIEQSDALTRVALFCSFLQGAAAQAQRPSQESGRGVRCFAHEAGLPVLGGGL